MSEDIDVGAILEALNNKADRNLDNLDENGKARIRCRNVGDIFYTTRTDTELNGAVECNGATFSTNDFIGDESIGALLNANKVPYVSLEEYASLVSANGSCRAFGWDGGDSFRVPTIPALLLTKDEAAVIGNGMTLGLTNSTDNYGVRMTRVDGNSGLYATQEAYGVELPYSNTGGTPPANGAFLGVTTDPTKSGLIANLDTVQYRAMVQLANDATNEALITATSAIQQIANKVDKTSATDRETVVGWGMPDYSAGIDIKSELTTSPYTWTAPCDGVIKAYTAGNKTWNINYGTNTTKDTTGSAQNLLYQNGEQYIFLTSYIPISKGETIATSERDGDSIIFYPYKGVQNV